MLAVSAVGPPMGTGTHRSAHTLEKLMYVIRFSLAHLPGVSIALVFDTIPTIDEVYERLVTMGILPADEAFTITSPVG